MENSRNKSLVEVILDNLEFKDIQDAYAVYDSEMHGYLEGYRGIVSDKEAANHYTLIEATMIAEDKNRQCKEMGKAPGFAVEKCKGKFRTYFIDADE